MRDHWLKFEILGKVPNLFRRIYGIYLRLMTQYRKFTRCDHVTGLDLETIDTCIIPKKIAGSTLFAVEINVSDLDPCCN